MKVPKGVNNFRRRVMNTLTNSIGSNKDVVLLNELDFQSIKKVLIVRPNHRLGNMLLTTPLLQETHDTFPNAKIDVLTKGGLARIVFKNYDCINDYIILPRRPFSELLKYIGIWLKMKSRRYDLVINAVEGSSSGKLLTLITSSKYKIFQSPNSETEDEHAIHNAKESICALRTAFSGKQIKTLSCDIPVLDLKLSQDEIANGKQLLDALVDNTKKTIAIFTFATGTKCYSTTWWDAFYSRLKIDFSNYNILEILPYENVSQINFEATSYYSKDIREMAAVMGNCDVFIGADCGVMHLASASGVPTIGLFTGRIKEYTPYGNLNCAIDTTKTSLDDWMAKITETLDLVDS